MPDQRSSNYAVLPPVDRQRGPGLGAISHDRLRKGRYSGVLDLQVEAVDRWRVGSGTVVPVVRPKDGQRREELAEDLMWWRGEVPVLPGSSIKGTLRTLVEVLTGGDQPSSDAERELSPASSLFGAVNQGRVSFRGRIGFDDALPAAGSRPGITVEELPAPYEPRAKQMTGPRIYGAPVDRPGEIPYLVVERGSRYQTRCTFLNLDAGELGLLARVMGLDGRLCPRLGGGKFAGLGRMRFSLRGGRIRSGVGPLRPLTADEARDALADWLRACPLSPAQQDVMAVLIRQMGAP